MDDGAATLAVLALRFAAAIDIALAVGDVVRVALIDFCRVQYPDNRRRHALRSASAPVDAQQFPLTLTCPERASIVHAVSRFLLEHGADIIDNRQFGDRRTGGFFMRMHFATGPAASLEAWGPDFQRVASAYQMH